MKQLHVGFCRKFLFARIFFEKVHSSPKRGLFLIACMMVEDQEYLKTLYIAIKFLLPKNNANAVQK